MTDEPDTPQNQEKLAAEIQKAVKAYSEFQSQLALAVKPWQEQWATMSQSLKPLQEHLRTMTEGWTTLHEQWAQQAETLQKAFQEGAARWAQVWAESQAALAKELAEAGPCLRRTLERADHVGRLGWTVTMRMTPSDMVRLSVMQVSTEADEYMLAWYENVDKDLTRLEKDLLDVNELQLFHPAISQCFSAYRRGDYAITIPCLVAVLERGVRNLARPEYFFSTKIEKVVKDRYSEAKDDDPDAIEVYFLMSLYAFVQWLYQQYGPTTSGEDRIFRHGIQHGTQAPPNEKIEVLRLLHAIGTVAGLNEDANAESASV